MKDKRLDIPQYKQMKRDYACGPVCVGMVIDYLRKRHRKKPLNFQECQRIFDETMNGNLRRTSGTSKQAMKNTLRGMGCKVKRLAGNENKKFSQIKDALHRHHPVIVSCRTTIEGKRYAHYIVITDMDENYLYFNDPYPRKRDKVIRQKFLGRGKLFCWGSSQWGIEVFYK